MYAFNSHTFSNDGKLIVNFLMLISRPLRLCHYMETCRWLRFPTSKTAWTLTLQNGLPVSPARWAHSLTFWQIWSPLERTTCPTSVNCPGIVMRWDRCFNAPASIDRGAYCFTGVVCLSVRLSVDLYVCLSAENLTCELNIFLYLPYYSS